MAQYLDLLGLQRYNTKIHEEIGDKVDKEIGKGLSTNDFTNELLAKLNGIDPGATATIVDTVLSDTSTNPVENKTIKAAIDSVNDDIKTLIDDSHGHINASVLKETTASYTVEEKSKLAAFNDASTYALKSDIAGVYKYKGSVINQSSLPTSGNVTGDVYNVEDTGMNFAWAESGVWDPLGMSLVINTISNSEIDELFN